MSATSSATIKTASNLSVASMTRQASDPAWLQTAFGEVGQQEIRGERDNPRIVHYHSFTTLRATDDETPWCASFVAYCLEANGITSTKSAASRSYVTWGASVDVKRARRGDVVVFNGGPSRPAWSGHVGFFLDTAVVGRKAYIVVLGGNQSNRVKVSLYPASRLLSVRRVKRPSNSKVVGVAAAVAVVQTVAAVVQEAAAPISDISDKVPMIKDAAEKLAQADSSQVPELLAQLGQVASVGASLPGPVGSLLGVAVPAITLFGVAFMAYDRIKKIRGLGI